MVRLTGEGGVSTGAGGVGLDAGGDGGQASVDARDPSAERRLIAGVTRAAAEHGFAALTVERVLSAAGVSRATFYQYFTCLDDCFWCAYREHAAWLADRVRSAANAGTDREAAVLGGLVDAMVSRPDVARMLAGECMAAGPAGLVERDRLVASLAGVMTGAPEAAVALDLPARTLVGGTLGFLSMRLVKEPAAVLRSAVLEWAAAFARPPSRTSWTELFSPPELSGPSRGSALPAEVVGRGTARERILRATMFAVRERGFREATVANIVAVAGVSRRHFYNEFPNKRAAFIAAYELGFQRTLEACTPAFFSPGDWPERVWSSALAFTGFFATEPLIAHLGFVECFASGRDYVPRVHGTQLAFTLFLEEGFRRNAASEALSRKCAELTAAAIFDLAFDACRRGPGEHLRRAQPMAVYVALAPFLGTEEAGRFVAGKLSSLSGSSLAVA